MHAATEADPSPSIGWARRLGYAFLGFLAANVAMDVYPLAAALLALLHPETRVLIRARNSPIPFLIGFSGLFLLYGIISFVGWLVVGLPVVFLISPRQIARLPWIVLVAIAATLGPAAFFLIFLFVSGGHFSANHFSFKGGVMYGILASLASLAGFSTYCWLVRRRPASSAAR
jgi:hypothetical protein